MVGTQWQPTARTGVRSWILKGLQGGNLRASDMTWFECMRAMQDGTEQVHQGTAILQWGRAKRCDGSPRVTGAFRQLSFTLALLTGTIPFLTVLGSAKKTA